MSYEKVNQGHFIRGAQCFLKPPGMTYFLKKKLWQILREGGEENQVNCYPFLPSQGDSNKVNLPILVTIG